MKLFPKLALTVSALLLGTTVCLSVSFYLAEKRWIRIEADQECHALLQHLVHIAQESILTNDDLLLVKYTHWLQKWNPSLASASVVSPSGEVLAHSQPTRIGKAISPLSPAERNGELLILTQPVRLGTKWVATASVSFSKRHFEEIVSLRLRALQKRIGLVAAAAVAAGLVISFLLALSWTRPIGSLARAAAHVGKGQYQLSLADTSRRKDELGFLSRAFQTMAVQLQELDQMKEDFVSAVTHELRSPLGAIESYLNLIQEEIDEGISKETWKTYLERLKVNTQRLTRFVNDLLDVAALERGKVVLERQPVNTAILIQDVVSLYRGKFMEKKLNCRTPIPKEALPDAWADSEKVRQVLVNLVSNAVKFTPEGGTIEVGVSSIPVEKSIRLFVKDSGLGIAEEDQATIFNKFEQVQSARQTIKGPKGTGLGLSICRALVELHGGTLGVDSKPGEGSCFYFTLPVVPIGKEHAQPKRIQGELV